MRVEVTEMRVETKETTTVWQTGKGTPILYRVRYPVLEREQEEHLLLVFADEQEQFWGGLNPAHNQVKAAAVRYARTWTLEGHGAFGWDYKVYRLTPEEAKALRRALVGEEKEGRVVVREAEALGILPRTPILRGEVVVVPVVPQTGEE